MDTHEISELLKKYTPEEIQEQPMEIRVKWTWGHIVCALESDSMLEFESTTEEFERAKSSIEDLINQGYFDDDPYSITSSFCEAAMGEESEAREFFSRYDGGVAYSVLNDSLNALFERGR